MEVLFHLLLFSPRSVWQETADSGWWHYEWLPCPIFLEGGADGTGGLRILAHPGLYSKALRQGRAD